MMFAVSGLILQREPMGWADLGGAVALWVQNVGAVALLGLLVFMLAQFLTRRHPFAPVAEAYRGPRGATLATVATVLVAASLAGYGIVALVGLASLGGGGALSNLVPRAGQGLGLSAGDYVASASGAIALGIVCAPILLNLPRMRWGRIWALARLSLKEAVRSRVVAVFGAMALVFLFADWFVRYKPEDQVRNYVRVVYWSMTPLFLVVASLLGAMSIPADIKSQAIHTIVTKPVEKFEVVLGRFLGYAVLLTVGVLVIAVLSLGYVVRGVNPEAERESYKARVPVVGKLGFVGTQGESVGREFDYRRYISGPQASNPNAPRQFAIWDFDDLPGELAARGAPVQFEFTFDIFRLSKGEENKGIYTTFTFTDGSLTDEERTQLLSTIAQESDKLKAAATKEYEQALARARTADEREKAAEEYSQRLAGVQDELISRFRVFEVAGFEVTDYHTQSIEIPSSFFKAIADHRPKAAAERPDAPAMRVLVSVDRARESQMLGVARYDFYLLAAERPFWQNFLKGVVGMWCTFMLVLGVSVALSTYLSGIISWLCTMFLYFAGMFTDHLQRLAANQMEGGGPSEALYRLATRQTLNAPLDESPTVSVLKGTDAFFSWWLRRLLNLIPDVNRFDLHQYVANGFDIPWSQVLLVDNLLVLAGYLIPAAILGYYLMRFREVANPN